MARRNAGLPDTVHLPDLRHAGATLAAQAGATTQELMARLGHGSPRAASSTNTPPSTGTEPSLMACNAWPAPSGPT
ncbi:hypothetical protein K6U06_19850 [Acidiferrimicrobium sp. IK]|uniref:hypothetical protein n=1 Tax=Acidiferrimicrobium sp. IK TaxID=2871700 RepID=UPI0021CB6691|nr:hypothetical protein [Acidiferrimicrobium sp. IK]MCU4186628.1 hypothetical protein [Acidiferrimicrobium sp. IK]